MGRWTRCHALTTPSDARSCSNAWTEKLGFVQALGADHAIDCRSEDFAEGDRRWDVLNIGGNTPLSRLRGALTPTETLVIVGGEDGRRLTGMGRQMSALALSPSSASA